MKITVTPNRFVAVLFVGLVLILAESAMRRAGVRP